VESGKNSLASVRRGRVTQLLGPRDAAHRRWRSFGYPNKLPPDFRIISTIFAMEWKRRVLVVEDDPLIRALISESLVKAHFDVDHSPDVIQAKQILNRADVDAAVIDVNLGQGPSGVQLGQWIHRTKPHIALIFLTKYPDPRSAGLNSWELPPGSSMLSKDRISNLDELVHELEATLRSSAAVTRHDLHASGPLSKITKTQFEILRLAAHGLTNSAIAAQRKTTERAVEQRLQAVYQALDIPINPDVNPRTQAVRIFFESGGITGPPPLLT
jgi:DNA-binding NarL/FixJ family response regulator